MSHPCLRMRRLLALLLLASGASSCGLGAVSLFSSSGGGQGDVNSAPAASALTVFSEKSSPAVLRFMLTDAESDAVDIEITYVDQATGMRMPATLTSEGFEDEQGSASISDATVTGLATAPGGREHFKTWDFATDLGLAPEESADVQLRLEIVGGGGSSAPPAQPAPTQRLVGNEPPGDPLVEFPSMTLGEIEGRVPVRLSLVDPTEDTVVIRIEYQIVGGLGACADLHVARDAELLPTDPDDEFQVDTDADGEVETFFWDTLFVPQGGVGCSLSSADVEVMLRLTIQEVLESGDDTGHVRVVEEGPILVDNNRPPFVVLGEGNLIADPDGRRGIPVPLRLIDGEGDPVEVVVQWTREGEEFPLLPATPNELRALLREPRFEARRRELRIATELPRVFRGRVGASNGGSPDRLRLPELASTEVGVLAGEGLAGRAVELLRASTVPAPAGWPTGPLVNPVASVALREGSAALVLDEDPSGWRVREVALDDGTVRSTLATGAGSPRALAFDPLHLVLWVATDAEVFRLSFPDGVVLETLAHGFTSGPRAIVPIGESRLAATGDDELRTLESRPLVTNGIITLVEGLAEPWGVAVHPTRPEALFLSERGADRILVLDRRTLELRELLATVAPADAATLGAVALPSPRAIAFEARGTRLLVAAEAAGGVGSLRVVPLGSAFDLDDPADGKADADVAEVLGGFDPLTGIATGGDQLRLLTTPGATELAIGGGVQRRASIVPAPLVAGDPSPYDPSTQEVLLTEPISVDPGTPWRIALSGGPRAASSAGTPHTFLWDTSDVFGGGDVRLRVRPFDADLGVDALGSAFKTIRQAQDVEPLNLGGATTMLTASLVVADLDGDGDLDLADQKELYFQDTPGRFVPAPSPLTGIAVGAGDLDGDGDVDLLASEGTAGLRVFSQGPAGVFTAATLIALPSSFGLDDVELGDLDGDGDLDVVVVNGGVGIALQTAPGSFTPSQLVPVSTVRRVEVGDLDEDGDLDIARLEGTGLLMPGNLVVSRQVMPGVFQDVPGLPTDVGPTDLEVCDIDSDGDFDLVTVDILTGIVPGLSTVYLQTSPGTFELAPESPLAIGQNVKQVRAADLDGDGDQDLLFASVDSNDATAYFQTPEGLELSPRTVPLGRDLPDAGLSVGLFHCADLEGDGDVDIVAASFAGDGVALVLADGPGDFAQGVGPSTGIEPIALTVADLDGDGDRDLVSADEFGLSLTLAFQQGARSFPGLPTQLACSAALPVAVEAADLDGDGDIDLACLSDRRDVVTLYFQVQPGVFGDPVEHPVVDDPMRMTIADLDADGDLDIVAKADFDGITTLVQGPAGVFTDTPLVSFMGQGDFVTAVDIEGDGDVDLLVSDAPETRLLLQDASGAFVEQGSITGSQAGILVEDFDGDGDLDVATGVPGVGIQIAFQTAPATFVQGPVIPGNSFQVELVAGDLDADGDVDIAALTPSGIDRYFQVQPGVFRVTPAQLPVPPTASGLELDDLDGDGELDFATVDTASGRFIVYYGGR